MTEHMESVKSKLSKMATALGILVILAGIVASYTRMDAMVCQTAELVQALQRESVVERVERIASDNAIRELIIVERDTRKDEYTRIQVKLSEIDTRLLYIQQAVDRIGSK